MIAACPKCQTRYRVEPERLGPDGARLRCSQCSAVFRVRVPGEAPREASPARDRAVSRDSAGLRGASDLHLDAPRRSSDGPPAQGRAHASGGAAPGAGARSASAREASAIDGRGASRSEAPASDDREARATPTSQPRSAEGRSATNGANAPAAPTFDRSRLVLIAHPDTDRCKRLAEALEREGLQVLVAHDGVEAILSIQRALPRAVVLDAALPKMFGFQVCELVKRNESLRVIHVCLMGAIHKEERYRRAPGELYGADFYVEPPDLPGALLEWLARLDLPVRGGAAPPELPAPPPGSTEAPVPAPAAREAAPVEPARPEPRPAESREARAPRAAGDPAESPLGAARQEPEPSDPAVTRLTLGSVGAAEPLAAERAQAERLARIIVSDIVLYNEEKFAAAVRGGSVLETLRDELSEGRALFRERIDPRVRDEKDFLAEELVRVARARGMQ
jgi:predicted Zn finger-like uncharacterized protein